MKILLSAYACEPNRGSEPGVGWNWALALVRLGHHVTVITRANNKVVIEQELKDLGEPYASKLNFLYYDTSKWILKLKKSGLGVPVYYAIWQRGILKLAKEAHITQQFDVVQHITFGVWRQPTQMHKLDIPCIFGPVGGGESAPWTLINGIPTLKAKVNEYLRFSLNGLSLLNPSLYKCFKQSKLIVSKTPETAAWIAKFGYESMVSQEIGIDPERINQHSLAIIPGKIRCLYAGRLIGWKGLHLALMAIAEANSQNLDANLTIVGNGALSTVFKNQAKALGVEDKVEFVGQLNQEELFDQYRQHDVLLFPSLHDSSGNVVLESFAQSLPVVCLKLGGPSVMVDDNCGRAIDTFGVSQNIVISRLAEALVELSENPNVMKNLRENVRKRAEESSWDDAVNRVYSKVKLQASVV